MTERLKLVESFRQSVAALVRHAVFLFNAVQRGTYDANQRETLLTELGNVAAEVRQSVDGGVDALIRPTTGTKPGEWTSELLRSMAAVCDDLKMLARNWFAAAGAADIDTLLRRQRQEADYRPILERTRQRLLELQTKSDFLSNFDASVVEPDGTHNERPNESVAPTATREKSDERNDVSPALALDDATSQRKPAPSPTEHDAIALVGIVKVEGSERRYRIGRKTVLVQCTGAALLDKFIELKRAGNPTTTANLKTVDGKYSGGDKAFNDDKYRLNQVLKPTGKGLYVIDGVVELCKRPTKRGPRNENKTSRKR